MFDKEEAEALAAEKDWERAMELADLTAATAADLQVSRSDFGRCHHYLTIESTKIWDLASAHLEHDLRA